jgi:hypothetical protein
MGILGPAVLAGPFFCTSLFPRSQESRAEYRENRKVGSDTSQGAGKGA